MQMVTLEKIGANLVIRPIPERIEDIADARDDYEVIEYYLCNGWDVVRPEEVGALTEGLIITDDCERDDRGTLIHVGRVYWHESYQIESIADALIRRGKVVLFGY